MEEELPVGIQSFEKIRTDGFLCVDKTDHVYQLVHHNVPYFLSRPRRFGKSLLLSTMNPLLCEVADIVVITRLGSTAGLQRRLKIGYARAGSLLEALETKGIVGLPNGSASRDILVTRSTRDGYRASTASSGNG